MGTQVASGTYNAHKVLLINSGDTDRYAVFCDSSGLYIYNDVDGTPSSLTSRTNDNIWGASTAATIRCLDAVMDSNDDIWVAVAPDDASETPQIIKYDVGLGSWGSPVAVIPSWTEAPDGTEFVVGIDIDTNDYPCVIFTNYYKYKGVLLSTVYFRYYNLLSWSTPEQVVSLGLNDAYTRAFLMVRGSVTAGDVDTIIWNNTDSVWEIRNRNAGSWGTASAYSNGVAPTGIFGGHGLIVYDGAVYRYVFDGSDNVYENDSDTSQNLEATLTSIAATVISGVRYVLGTSPTASDELDLLDYDTSWNANTGVEDTGTAVYYPALYYCYNLDNNPTSAVPYLYTQSGDVYYGSYTLSGVTTYYVTVTGSITPAGVLTRLYTYYKSFTGGLTPSGVLTRLYTYYKSFAGGLTPTGVLTAVKTYLQTITGGLTPSGVLTKVTTLYQTIAGAITPTGVLTKAATWYKSIAGSLTPTGVLTAAKTYLLTITGGLTPSGEVTTASVIGVLVEGGITPSGVLTKIKIGVQSIAGSLAPSGVLTKVTTYYKSIAGNLTPTGVLAAAKTLYQTVAGAIAPTGVLTAVKMYLQTITGAIAPSGVLTKVKTAYQTITGSLNPTGVLTKVATLYQTIAGTITPSGVLTKVTTYYKTIAGAFTSSGALSLVVTLVGAVQAFIDLILRRRRVTDLTLQPRYVGDLRLLPRSVADLNLKDKTLDE